MTFVTTSNGRTVLVDEAVEAGAARAAVEPEHEGVPGGVAFRLHQVVEEAPPVRLVHRHVPGVVPGGEVAGAAVEAREARDEMLLRRRGGKPEDERGGYEEGEDGGEGHEEQKELCVLVDQQSKQACSNGEYVIISCALSP